MHLPESIRRLFRSREFGPVAALILMIAVLAIGALIDSFSTRQLADSHRLVSHTYEVIYHLEKLISNLKDAETTQRGYLLTEDPLYLERYAKVLKNVEGDTSTLQNLIKDNSAQQERLTSLHAKILTRLELSNRTVDTMRNGDEEGALRLVEVGGGRALMDQIRAEVTAMQQVEYALLNVRSQSTGRSYRFSASAIVLSLLISLASVIAAFVLFRRHLHFKDQIAAVEARHREELRATLTSIGDGVISTDREGRVTFLNPVSETLTGWKDQEARGLPLSQVFQIVNETTRQTVENPAVRALKKGVVVGLANHTILIAKDGTERPIDDSAAPIRGEDGEVIGCVLVFRDITERKAAERQVHERDVRMTAMLQSSLDAIITIDHRGDVVEFNPAAERIFGYSSAEAVGKELAALIIPPAMRDRHREGMKRLVETGESRILNRRLELSALRADGSEFPVELSITRITEEGPAMFTGYIRDITERRQVEMAQSQRAAELAEADRRKTEFLAALGHELRNPMAPIRTGLEVMKLSPDLPERAAQIRDMMERQVRQMVRLIDDLLDVARITSGRLEMKPVRASLREIVQPAVEATQPFIQEAGHELSLEVPETPIWLMADPNRLAQVISNLLNNAAKYTPPGGRIQVTVKREAETAVVKVKDSGVGIPAEKQGQIFEMFTQVDRHSERGHGGLGIGLTIVKRIVEMHHGTIQVVSEGADAGSEFIVRLPIVPAPAGETGASGQEAPSAAVSPKRILVVDDNEAAAETLALMISLHGHEVMQAYNGEEAVSKAESFQPDLIVMDLGMPVSDGYEAARKIRAQPWGRMKLVALTGWGQEEDRQRTFEAGFDHYLIKPVDSAELQRLISELS